MNSILKLFNYYIENQDATLWLFISSSSLHNMTWLLPHINQSKVWNLHKPQLPKYFLAGHCCNTVLHHCYKPPWSGTIPNKLISRAAVEQRSFNSWCLLRTSLCPRKLWTQPNIMSRRHGTFPGPRTIVSDGTNRFFEHCAEAGFVHLSNKTKLQDTLPTSWLSRIYNE